MAESVSDIEAYELAAAILGADEDDDDAIDAALYDRCGIDMAQFACVVAALIPFTIPAQIVTFDERTLWARGFVDKGAFIVKREFKP
jgi:hypothetical protein